MFLPLKLHRAHFLVRPWLSLVLVDTSVNKETQTLLNEMEKQVPSPFIHRPLKVPFEAISKASPNHSSLVLPTK